MPKFFGEGNGDFNNDIAVKVFGSFGVKALLISGLVSKDWNQIINSDDLKNVYEIARDKWFIFNFVISKCSIFNEESLDTFKITRLSGWSNTTFKLQARTGNFVVRIPGKGSDQYIDRDNEYINASYAYGCDVGVEIVYFDAKAGGVQVTRYLKNPTTMSAESFHDHSKIEAAMRVLKVIHNADFRFANDLDVFERNFKMYEKILASHFAFPNDYQDVLKKMQDLHALFCALKIETFPCHNDTTPENFICSDNRTYLIDWEYSGNNDPVWDFAYLSMEAKFTDEQDQQMFVSYYGAMNPLAYSRFVLYKPVVEFWIALWARTQIINNNQSVTVEALEVVESERFESCKRYLACDAFRAAFDHLKASLVVANEAGYSCEAGYSLPSNSI